MFVYRIIFIIFLYDIHANIIIISFEFLIFLCAFIEHYPIINNNNVVVFRRPRRHILWFIHAKTLLA